MERPTRRNRTSITTARNLVRRLDDPGYLRRNELVAHFFVPALTARAATQQVRELVYEAIDSLKAPDTADPVGHGARQHAIITRYDLEREPLHRIAADLGIAQSKFYYERRAALARITEFMLQRRPSMASGRGKNRHPVDAEHFALSLHRTGHVALSISVLNELIAEAQIKSRRAILLCHLVSVLCDDGRVIEAFETLSSARDAVDPAAPNDREHAAVRAEVDFATLQCFWCAGDVDKALRIGRGSLEYLRSFAAGDDCLRVLFARHALWVGALLLQRGYGRTAIGILEEAVGHMRSCTQFPNTLRAELLKTLANGLSLSADTIMRASNINAEAMEAATSECSLETLSGAYINKARLNYWSGKRAAALLHARQAVAFAESGCGPEGRTLASLFLARIEGDGSNMSSALERILQSRPLVPQYTYSWIVSHVLEAELLNRRGQHAGALRAACVAAETAQETRSFRTLGVAMRVVADSYEHLGELEKAADALGDCISLLEQYGDPHSLEGAFEFSARLTGNRKHLRNAAELRRAISS